METTKVTDMDTNEEELHAQEQGPADEKAAENTCPEEQQTTESAIPENDTGKPEEKSGWKKIFGGKDKKDEKPAEKTPEERIQELTLKLAESERLRLLALAEMDNQRKRASKERDQVRMNTTQDTISPFLQVFDYFTMAVAMAQKTQNFDSLLQGMNMIQQLFDKALTELDVEKIDAVGKKFDPLLHDAKEQRPSDTVPAGVVIEQWNMGYKMGDRLLKPAMVIVSSGKPAPEPEPAPEEEKGAETQE